jgi:hypothetical protein
MINPGLGFDMNLMNLQISFSWPANKFPRLRTVNDSLFFSRQLS